MESQPPYPLHREVPKSNRFRGITLGRLDQFEGGQYAERNLTAVLFEGRDDSAEAVSMEWWPAPGLSKPSFDEATKQRYTPIAKGHRFGPSWSNHWLRVTIKIKPEWRDKERVQFEFDPGCEAMLFDTEGLPLQGITGGYGGDRRVEFIIPPEKRSFPRRYYIEVTANGMFGVGEGDGLDMNRYFTLDSADIVVPRMEAWHLLWDFRVIRDITRNLSTTAPLCLHAQTVAMDIVATFRHDDLSTIAKCRTIAERVLGKGWQKQGAGVFCDGGPWDGVGGAQDAPVLAIGNCHIDTAWLWPFSATQQKSARSWSTQIDLMERYEEYRFTTSQAQQFKWLERLYPQLFQRVRTFVEKGSFQIIGGSWVEHDTNMPSGEALCRQFSFGQRYFKSRFGKFCQVFWLPDSFGYSSQIPQFCRLAGMPFFFTQKLSWSQFNSFPHHSYNWVGIDGTQVLVHMTPVDTYTAQASVADVVKAVAANKDLEWTSKGLLAYGNGDGGGGPLPPMLEGLRRIRAAANESRDLPKVTQGRSVPEFFADLLKNTDNGNELPTWRGELYLEYHRGTYTSHGSIKRHNRKAEVLLHNLEYAATLASLMPQENSKDPYAYPKEAVDSLWEDVLLCQFHDVLPGSAIALAYEDAERIYAHVARKGAQLLDEALSVLTSGSEAFDVACQGTVVSAIAGINTLSFGRQEIIKVAAAPGYGEAAVFRSQAEDDTAFVCMRHEAGQPLARLVTAAEFATSVTPATASSCVDPNGDLFFILANAFLEVRVSKTGRITSILDVALGRELLAPKTTAGFVIFQDQPLNFEAWDVDIFHLDTREEVFATSVSVAEPGGLRASLLLEYQINETRISTYVSLDAIGATVDADALSLVRFDNVVDWHERRQFLKFELPLNINADKAIYETQYGFLERPTHQNTSWDKAKFEVCAHRFADLSEFGYGVALLNDCKYGYSCIGNRLRLSLLRGSRSPDPEQDQGWHKFAFAILPHRGSFLESSVPQAAAAFNTPMLTRRLAAPGPGLAMRPKLASSLPTFHLSGARNAFIDTVKRGDDDTFAATARPGAQTVILRVYEAFGGQAVFRITTSLGLTDASIVDILERFQEPVDFEELRGAGPTHGTVLKLKLRPFQVLTLRLTLR